MVNLIVSRMKRVGLNLIRFWLMVLMCIWVGIFVLVLIRFFSIICVLVMLMMIVLMVKVRK